MKVKPKNYLTSITIKSLSNKNHEGIKKNSPVSTVSFFVNYGLTFVFFSNHYLQNSVVVMFFAIKVHCSAGEQAKNEHAFMNLTKILDGATWINIHQIVVGSTTLIKTDFIIVICGYHCKTIMN